MAPRLGNRLPTRHPLRARGGCPAGRTLAPGGGDKAIRLNAHHEAVAALTKGLALLGPSPITWRAPSTTTLQLILGALLMAAKGYAVPEAGEYIPGPIRCVSRWGSRGNVARRSRASPGFILSRHSCA